MKKNKRFDLFTWISLGICIWYIYALIIHLFVIDKIELSPVLYIFFRITATFGLGDEAAVLPFVWVPALSGVVGIIGALLRREYSIERRVRYAVYPLIISVFAIATVFFLQLLFIYFGVALIFLIAWTAADIIMGCKMKLK